MTRQEIDHPDAALAEAEAEAERQARRLLELAGTYVRDTLQLPGEVATLRSLVAELLLEVGFARQDIRRLTERIEALEREHAQIRIGMRDTRATRDTRDTRSAAS